jgi:RimJ/RimL family protein N-acetyltransferase
MSVEVAAVKLREWLETDLPFLLAVRNNVALQAQLLATARGSDEAAVRAWLTRRTEGPERIFRVIAETKTDRPVGFLQADVVNESLDGWSFGICIDPPFQGVGYGTMALVALERELADRFGARNIKLEVDSANYRAIRCYKRLGYEEQGAPAREVMVCDKPRKAIAMAKSLERIGDHQ